MFVLVYLDKICLFVHIFENMYYFIFIDFNILYKYIKIDSFILSMRWHNAIFLNINYAFYLPSEMENFTKMYFKNHHLKLE